MRAASLRDIGANRTGPATLPRHTGHGARGCGLEKPDKAGRTAEIGRMLPPGLTRNPPGSDLPGAHLARGKNRGLQRDRLLGKLIAAKQMSFRPRPDMQTRLPRRVLRSMGSVLRPREKGRARGQFRAFRESARLSPAHQPDKPQGLRGGTAPDLTT